MNATSRTLVIAASMIVALASCGGANELADRQAAVARAGANVMPFDLDATTHIFTDTETGGTQEIVADDPSDVSNIEMIKQHLMEEAVKFRAGDFSDPETIHGATMPGLAVLKDRYREIDVQLSVSETGATLTYATSEPELVTAIHEWFSAQTADHGSHAEHGS